MLTVKILDKANEGLKYELHTNYMYVGMYILAFPIMSQWATVSKIMQKIIIFGKCVIIEIVVFYTDILMKKEDFNVGLNPNIMNFEPI